MSKIEDGGPAYPLPNWDQMLWPKGTPADYGTGMTMRDWFAGQALAGMLTSERDASGYYKPGEGAARAYEFADAMLKARQP